MSVILLDLTEINGSTIDNTQSVVFRPHLKYLTRKPRRLYDEDSIEGFTVKKCGDRVISSYAPPRLSILCFGFGSLLKTSFLLFSSFSER